MKGDDDDDNSSSEAPIPPSLDSVFITKDALYAAVILYCKETGHSVKPDSSVNNKTRMCVVLQKDVREGSFPLFYYAFIYYPCALCNHLYNGFSFVSMREKQRMAGV
jgi:hypothetical protein